ncbi:hypothetical protein BC940DRAFT_313951 [Gongronella butleri]|nr:hypothetical protein BC940DRAFT_313951 [Gongronella butleri]
MFQQFKSYFPASSNINLRSITDTVGMDEDGFKRLKAFASELAKINALTPNHAANQGASTFSSAQNDPATRQWVDTAELVARLQRGYTEIYTTNRQLQEKSMAADLLLGQLVANCAQHHHVCATMTDALNDMASVRENMAALTASASDLKTHLAALDQQIERVTMEEEKHQLDLWKQRQEQQFAAEMEQRRMDLAAMERQLEQSHKDQEAQQAQKRLELYNVTFEAEMEDYRRRRETQVSSLYQVSQSSSGSRPPLSTTLENLHIDDKHAANDLDSFLSDEENEKQQDTSATRRRAKKPTPANHHDDEDDDEDDDGPVVEILGDEDYASD